MKRKLSLPIFIAVFFLLSLTGYPEASGKDVPVIAMCRPTLAQIENIIILKNAGLLTPDNLHLLCVYHEDELTDYSEPEKYVRDKRLNWINFIKISGIVAVDRLFKKNIWTSQFRAVFNSSDGIIFTGGMDIPSRIYGEENSLLTEATTPARTYYEVSFLFHLIGSSKNPEFVPFLENRRNYPVLGICLGSQTMNVAAGGTLYQDIPSEIYGYKTVEEVLRSPRGRIHSSRYAKLLNPARRDSIPPAFHKIKISDESIILKKFLLSVKYLPYVLSSHHQSVKKLGKDLFIAAKSMDGKIVEGIEHKRYRNVLGVQFHPEYRELYNGYKLYKNNPVREGYFIIKEFIKDQKGTFEFHKRLWNWFSSFLKKN